MRVTRIGLANFRNHESRTFDFSDFTYIEGPNGSGKTSAVEALAVLFTMKSFKRQQLKEMVRFDAKYLRIRADIESADRHEELLLTYDGTRTLKDAGEVISDVTSFVHDHPVFWYSPDATGILSRTQDERRSTIDRIAFSLDKSHAKNLRDYRRIIAQKTAMFHSRKVDITFLDALNEQLVSINRKIVAVRQKAVTAINTHLAEVYHHGESWLEGMTLRYTTNEHDTKLLASEAGRRRCLYGSHRDRLYAEKDGGIFDKFSSFGQRKTFVLLVLYACLLTVEENFKDDIIVILDDFEAGLDETRVDMFTELFSRDNQLIITGVKNTRLPNAYTITL